jgi:hypothetical protein
VVLMTYIILFLRQDIGLLQLVVVHADLIGHLKALKDYFLLAKGDFFQASFHE